MFVLAAAPRILNNYGDTYARKKQNSIANIRIYTRRNR
ncbi:Uncharacterized protein dnm_033980 [Desulfonema magnum]|uniref:Uncharacterized protein n=1 Tax=Desulfonema magnum TaxID=45655 RepID=A0A975BL27_9BACT|nr:Uncharacterized protein dnm_033980 [Desulfonema magnum]